MFVRSWIDQHKNRLWLMIAGGWLAVSPAQHIFHLWDEDVVWLVLYFLVFSPLAGWLLSRLLPPFIHAFQLLRTKQVLFILSAVVVGLLLTWQFYRAPVSTQTITITPQLSQNQQVELLEIKAAGSILAVETQALQRGWTIHNGILTASQASQPFRFSFRVPVNSSIEILVNSSPEGGNLLLTVGRIKREVNLTSPSLEQNLVRFQSQFHGIPNWLFLPFLVIADFLTFFVLILGKLILQENGQRHLVEEHHERFLSKRTSLLILIILTGVLHLFSALAVPLIVDSDSPSHLEGAVHFLQHGNLDGVSMIRGPVSAFLFAPALLIFGRNPWGMKLILHLIATGCVLLGYRLGWQLTHKRWVAFYMGLVTMLLPDLYYYANFIMTDLPNIFLVVLFTSLWLDVYDSWRFSRLILTLLVGSIASLLRSENILLLVIGVAFLSIQPGWEWLKYAFRKNRRGSPNKSLHSLGMLLLASLISLIPLIWWSAHNDKLHGFFGLGNYGGVVLYDGWMYYAEASGLKIRAENSPAVQEIDYWMEKYPHEISDGGGVATGWEVYPSLIQAGYSSQAAFDLLEQATWDSIKLHYRLIPDILKLKFRDSFRPRIAHPLTFPLPGETVQPRRFDGQFFDPAAVSIPWMISTQRTFFRLFQNRLAEIYRLLTLLSLAAVFLSIYRKPHLKWSALALIVLTRISVSNLMSLSQWRYTLSGIVLLVVFGVTTLVVLIYGVKDLFIHSRKHPA